MRYSSWICLLSLCGATTILAQEEAAENPVAAATPAPVAGESSGRGGNWGPPGGGMSGGGFEERRQAMEARLKASFPEEYAEIEKLRTNDPAAASTKMRELMRKSDLGGRGFSRPGGAPGGMRDEMEALTKQLKERFPEEYAEIEKLRATDPSAAQTKLQALIEKAGLKMPEIAAEPVVTLRDQRSTELARVKAELKRHDAAAYAALAALEKRDPDVYRVTFRKMVADAGIKINLSKQKLEFSTEEEDSATASSSSSSSRGRGSSTNGGGGFPGMMGPPPWAGGDGNENGGGGGGGGGPMMGPPPGMGGF